MPTETPPATPALPGQTMPGAKSAAQPISQGQLQAELSKPVLKSGPVAQASPDSKPVPTEIKEEPKGNPPRPDFKASLRSAVMDKPEEKAEKKEAKLTVEQEPAKKAEPSPEDVPDDQLKVLPHDKPDTAKRIKTLDRKWKAADAEAARLRKELDDAKKATPTPANNEEIERLRAEHKAAQEEAMRYRRRYDLESDPEFSKKYREPVIAAESLIESKFKGAGFGEATLKAIKDAGGYAAFSRSKQTYPVSVDDKDNPGQKKTIHATGEELFRSWVSAFPVADEQAVRDAIGRQELLRADEQQAIKAAQADAQKYFEQQGLTQRQAQEAAQAAQKKTLEEYTKWLADTEAQTEWLKDKEIPSDASAEQKAAIEDDNKWAKQMRDRLRKDPTTATEYGTLKLEAAESHHLRRQNGALEAKIAALEAQLAKARGAMKTTPSGGSLMTKTAPAAAKDKNQDPTNWKAGLQRSMARAGGGIDEE